MQFMIFDIKKLTIGQKQSLGYIIITEQVLNSDIKLPVTILGRILSEKFMLTLEWSGIQWDLI